LVLKVYINRFTRAGADHHRLRGGGHKGERIPVAVSGLKASYVEKQGTEMLS